mmetsp:Transcript_32427/g.67025  ORF Transcript_32427/g.67025 Transcript_32427/m.67025 type:complete len:155 (-) Transcript_32427:449-913(-)
MMAERKGLWGSRKGLWGSWGSRTSSSRTIGEDANPSPASVEQEREQPITENSDKTIHQPFPVNLKNNSPLASASDSTADQALAEILSTADDDPQGPGNDPARLRAELKRILAKNEKLEAETSVLRKFYTKCTLKPSGVCFPVCCGAVGLCTVGR